jgi:hypothetical protein
MSLKKEKEMGLRKSERHALKTNALLFFKSNSTRVGFLKNISKEGATFEYVVLKEGEGPFDVGGHLGINIMVIGPVTFMIRGLECEVEYDVKVTYFTLGCVENRRCGLRFQKLSDDQARNLDLLLNAFTHHRSSGVHQISKPEPTAHL